MQETNNLPPNPPLQQTAVSGSYLLITKEYYSDGVSSVYEETFKALSLEHAKEEAFFKVQERNVELSKDGRCFIVDVRSV